VRLRNHEIHDRINGNLQIEFTDQKLTSFSGLELFNQYFRTIDLRAKIKKAFFGIPSNGDYRTHEIILTFIALWLSGGNRLRHIRYLCSDWLIKRVVGVKRIATERTLSRWLKRFTPAALDSLLDMNTSLVLGVLAVLELRRVTLNFDGTVLSTGNEVELAARGYNPHKRYAKSYYPFLCHIAQTGQFLRVKNRRGNLHDSKGGALSMISDCIRDVREKLGRSVIIEVRLDSAFFSEKILRFLIKIGVPYAVKMPLWKWTGIKELIQQRERWSVAAEDLSYFATTLKLAKWRLEVPVVIFRKCITKNNLKPKTFQLDLFDPGDGIYEYQVIATNQELTAVNVMDFYNGRCGMEREIAELKMEYGFANIPTKSFLANSAYQALAILTHSLVKNFQLATDQAPAKKRTSVRTTRYQFESLKSLRFKVIARAGRVVNVSGKSVLKMASEAKVEADYQKIKRALDRMTA
jgi:Transposase DDE domain group 1